MAWFSDNPSNVSSGGHVYDRTTGSWAGETQGSAGDGVDRSRAASEVKIWRDANGIVGYDEKTDKTITRTPAQKAWDAEQAAMRATAAKAKAAATKGPGSASAGQQVGGTVATGGPGAAASVAKPRGGSKLAIGSGPGNPFFSSKPPMEPGRKDKATGGFAGTEVHANPWFTNVEDFWEPRYGEPGEWLGGFVNIAADAIYNVPGVLNKLGVSRETPYLGADWTPNLDYHEMPGLPPVEPRPRR